MSQSKELVHLDVRSISVRRIRQERDVLYLQELEEVCFIDGSFLRAAEQVHVLTRFRKERNATRIISVAKPKTSQLGEFRLGVQYELQLWELAAFLREALEANQNPLVSTADKRINIFPMFGGAALVMHLERRGRIDAERELELLFCPWNKPLNVHAGSRLFFPRID